MDGFVSAVRRWVGFELCLTVGGLIYTAYTYSLIRESMKGYYGNIEWGDSQIPLVYWSIGVILFLRLCFLFGVLISDGPDKPLPDASQSLKDLEELDIKK